MICLRDAKSATTRSSRGHFFYLFAFSTVKQSLKGVHTEYTITQVVLLKKSNIIFLVLPNKQTKKNNNGLV